jgi:hypothetical protein
VAALGAARDPAADTGSGGAARPLPHLDILLNNAGFALEGAPRTADGRGGWGTCRL